MYLPTNANLNTNIIITLVRNLRLADENDINNYMILGDYNFIDHEKDKKMV